MHKRSFDIDGIAPGRTSRLLIDLGLEEDRIEALFDLTDRVPRTYQRKGIFRLIPI